MNVKTAVLTACAIFGCSLSAVAGQDPAEISPPSAQEKAAVQADATTKPSPAAVNSKRLINANTEPGQWMSHGRTYDEQRFSPLDNINPDNVSKLGLAWSFDYGTKRGIEATSIVVDGMMYTTSSWSIVHALDARTGKPIWSFDPKFAKSKAGIACCDAVNRGVAVWEGKVFVGVLDGRLIALDARDGSVVWEVATVDSEQPYTITGAPRIVKGRVLIGNGGAEFGVRGYVSAYNSNDGSLAWRFYTVPGNPASGFEHETMRMAAKTWSGEWWKIGGGGTVWDSMAYDPELDLIYIGVGNGTPWNQELRSPDGGDNLFLSSIVALRADTGEYVWHYQTTPGETWDYTATQHMILAELELQSNDGGEAGTETRKVLMQAPKNGFFYVLDRATGELLSADNYVNITWASHVDMKTGRPVELPGARYRDDDIATVFPSYLGGHNWHPMSYSPLTGLVYIPVLDFPAVYAADKDFHYRPGAGNVGTDGIAAGLPDSQAERDAFGATLAGRLLAWDPVKQREAWRVEHSGPWNGGVLSTAGGLVFQGTADAKFVAYRADDGAQLWQFPSQTGVVAAPISYELDGEQYVSINVGWGGAYALVFGEFVQPGSLPSASRVLTFKLGANHTLPAKADRPRVVFNPPQPAAGADALLQDLSGLKLYQDNCLGCHGLNAVSGMLIPDVRGSAYLHDAQGWRKVLQGALSGKGMPDMSGYLDEEQMELLRQYAIQQAWRGLQVQQENAKQ